MKALRYKRADYSLGDGAFAYFGPDNLEVAPDEVVDAKEYEELAIELGNVLTNKKRIFESYHEECSLHIKARDRILRLESEVRMLEITVRTLARLQGVDLPGLPNERLFFTIGRDGKMEAFKEGEEL